MDTVHIRVHSTFGFVYSVIVCCLFEIISHVKSVYILVINQTAHKVSFHVCFHRSPVMSGHEHAAGRSDSDLSMAVHGMQDLHYL